MANLFENKDRSVIPNWRSFGKTTDLGELNSVKIAHQQFNFQNIDNYIFDWKHNKTVIHAADLLSAAIVNNQKENFDVIEAAAFILKNKEESTLSQQSLADNIINRSNNNDWPKLFDDISAEKLSLLLDPEPIRIRIKNTRLLLKSYPSNAILYVELARYYSILGLEKNAVQSMKSALYLAPNNRFVLRCATRLFVHYNSDYNDYLDYIHSKLRNSPALLYDPWLMSAEISISTIRNRSSRLISKGIDLINSKNIHPLSFTELASSIGTIELLNGGLKKGRDLFRKALLKPNDNSLAQIEWASTKDKQLDINPAGFGVQMNFEALALENYHKANYKEALDNSAKWFIDMPFSKRPVMLASNLASMILKDQKKAISFLNAGLISHPNDPQLINNLAYSLALDDRPEEASKELIKLKSFNNYDEITKICITATKGLSYFRLGNADEGRKLYLQAIERTKEINNQELNWIAILNYAREEIRLKQNIEQVMQAVSKIPTSKDKEIEILRSDVIELYTKIKNK